MTDGILADALFLFVSSFGFMHLQNTNDFKKQTKTIFCSFLLLLD